MIPTEALPYFENAIYLPMLIIIFEKDCLIIEGSPIKFKSPYLKLVKEAIKIVQKELKETNIYLKKNSMQIIKKENDGTFTEYTFLSGGYEDHRRYLNVRLRNRSEELMSVYLAMAGN